MLEGIACFDSLNKALNQIPYAKLLGIQAIEKNGQPEFYLPFVEHNIGNVLLPAIHGGVIGGFLENAAVLHLMWAQESDGIPRVIDFSIDYLRSAKALDLHGRCEIVRQGKRVANVLMTAWQDDESKPVATARAHFLLS
ncbi:PaaI family thioesterase [Deefgea sp. CFH1-16]|uniref:PaaI family thioesterase n=1 Tax=Deefgea sp. CFH1-16 TaxID=2675457 RepID=UPI0015F38F6D|nr:PaaI family thioesterase [Deefgea sp. CFH1-16]MBM5575140.1 PaaI family thioesterase [Deefgea sp. CFH1-16]